jgi:hypothetical protein
MLPIWIAVVGYLVFLALLLLWFGAATRNPYPKGPPTPYPRNPTPKPEVPDYVPLEWSARG